MNLEDYLKQNIKPEILQKAMKFKNSSNYQAIKTYASSDKYQSAKISLQNRDRIVHKTIFDDIQKLQNKILNSQN